MKTAALIARCLLVSLVLTACSGTYLASSAGMQYAEVETLAGKIRLAYRDHGTGKPILLLHGFGASSYTWRYIEPELVVAGYRVLTIDFKGFGHSDKPLDENYSVFDQAKLVSSFIDKLGLKDVTLVGHSFGGGVALVLALEQKDKKTNRIERMVLIDSIAYAQNIPIALDILSTPVIGKLSSRIVPLELQIKVALKLAFHDDSKFTKQDVKRYAEPLRNKGSRHAMIQTVKQILPENLPELSARYKTIETPALIIWCDHDKVIKPVIGARLHKDLPNSTFRVISECGHLPQEEKPEATVRLLRDFLKK